MLPESSRSRSTSIARSWLTWTGLSPRVPLGIHNTNEPGLHCTCKPQTSQGCTAHFQCQLVSFSRSPRSPYQLFSSIFCFLTSILCLLLQSFRSSYNTGKKERTRHAKQGAGLTKERLENCTPNDQTSSRWPPSTVVHGMLPVSSTSLHSEWEEQACR